MRLEALAVLAKGRFAEVLQVYEQQRACSRMCPVHSHSRRPVHAQVGLLRPGPATLATQEALVYNQFPK